MVVAQRQKSSNRVKKRRAFQTFVLLVFVGLGLRAWVIMHSAQVFIGDIQKIQDLTQTPDRFLVEGSELLVQGRSDLAALRSDLGLLPTIAGRLGWVPVYGADLAAVAPLLDASERTLAAAESLSSAGAPLLPVFRTLNRTTLDDPLLAEQLAVARPAFERARSATQAAELSWAGITVEQLSPLLRSKVRQARTAALLMPGLASLGVATIDAYAAFAPLLPHRDAKDIIGQLLSSESALSQDLTRIAPALPVARASADFARVAWLRAPMNDLPEVPRRQIRQLAALPNLYLALISTAEAVITADRTLAPVLTERDPALPLGAAVASGLSTRRTQLVAVYTLFADAAIAWAAVPVGQLPPELDSSMKRVGPLLTAARDGLDLVSVLPALLGADGRHDYLLLAQSGDELRPTGGFITSAGLLSLAQGRVVGFGMEDSGTIAPDHVASPYAPAPLGQYMHTYRWLFRDANWSPDFPTAARVASDLYALSGRPSSRDVIALDLFALQGLLRAIGPITITGEADPLTADAVLGYMERQHDLYGSNNDHSVGLIAKALLTRLDAGALDLPALFTALRQLLDERHLQIVVSEPVAADLFARLGWDGAVRSGDRDFLMVVDANVGYSKANRSIRQEFAYEVDLRDPTTPVATLTMTYTHTALANTRCTEIDSRLPSYQALMILCYNDYVRVLTPNASYLLHAENAPSPAEWSRLGISDDGAVTSGFAEAGTRVFATYFALPPGQQHTLVLRYSLPETVVVADATGYHYQLHVQKQAGREPIPLHVSLRLPPGTTLMQTNRLEGGTRNDVYRSTLTLARDENLEVRFRLP